MTIADDEAAIRALIKTWMDASMAGDVATVLGLMTDDVVFLVAGQRPFGKEAFAGAAEAMRTAAIIGTVEVIELQALGDWAYAHCHLTVEMTPPGKPPQRRAGHTLTILRKEADGRWLLARDANLLGPI